MRPLVDGYTLQYKVWSQATFRVISSNDWFSTQSYGRGPSFDSLFGALTFPSNT